MIARTYYVQMPAAESGNVALDIIVEGYPGSPDTPIDSSNAPAGWNGGDGNYYEIRGRPLRLPNPSGTSGYVPRFNLGWNMSISRLGATVGAVPAVELSASLQASLDVTPLADPSYGAVIRLSGAASSVSGAQLTVQLQVMEAKDEDRTGEGT